MGFATLVCQNQSSVGHLTDKPLDLSVPSDHKQNCDMLTLLVKSNSKIKVVVFNIYHNLLFISEFNQLKGLQNVLNVIKITVIFVIGDFFISVMFSYLRNVKFEGTSRRLRCKRELVISGVDYIYIFYVKCF